MAAKLWYDVVTGEWGSQGLGQARKEQLIAEILKQTGAEEEDEEVEHETVELKSIEETEAPEFTATRPKDSPIVRINRMPKNKEELDALFRAENIKDFKSKVLYLEGALQVGRIHNIHFKDKTKYKKLFMNYLLEEKEKGKQ